MRKQFLLFQSSLIKVEATLKDCRVVVTSSTVYRRHRRWRRRRQQKRRILCDGDARSKRPLKNAPTNPRSGKLFPAIFPPTLTHSLSILFTSCCCSSSCCVVVVVHTPTSQSKVNNKLLPLSHPPTGARPPPRSLPLFRVPAVHAD